MYITKKKVGPTSPTSLSKVITPLKEVISPVTHLFPAIYRGHNFSILKDRLGARLGFGGFYAEKIVEVLAQNLG